MAAGILMDAIWQRVLKEELGMERMNNLALRFWEIIGEYSYPLVQMVLQIPQPEKATWEHVKKVIKESTEPIWFRSTSSEATRTS
jgi:hypothetical protein